MRQVDLMATYVISSWQVHLGLGYQVMAHVLPVLGVRQRLAMALAILIQEYTHVSVLA
jgi:hypothetical protein